MSIREIVKSAHRQLDEISAAEHRVVVLACIGAATLNALFLAYSFGYVDGDNGAMRSLGIPRDYSYDFMRLKIGLALVVIGIALRFRTVLWFCVSLLATASIGTQYLLWYLDTQRWLRDMRLTDLSQLEPGLVPHFAGIYQATAWDFALLVFATSIFVWQVRVLIALIVGTRPRQQSP